MQSGEVVSMALDPNQHQGVFGEAFVAVLATAAGLTVSRPYPDVTGEDFTLGHKGRLVGRRHPKIDVQVKSWSRSQATWRDGVWKYRMQANHFNDLADSALPLRRYLFLVIVPADATQYAVGGEGQLILSHAAYWVHLQGRDLVDPSVQATVSVDVPATNLLTVDSLRDLIEGKDDEEVRR